MLHLRTFSPNSAVSNLMLGSIKRKVELYSSLSLNVTAWTPLFKWDKENKPHLEVFRS